MPGRSPSDPRAKGSVPSLLRDRGHRPRGTASEAATGTRAAAASSPDPLEAGTAPAHPTDRPSTARLDPGALPLPGLSRRRLATLAGVVAAVWLVLAFGRQVGEASAASNRADALRATNAQLRDSVDSLQADVTRVQDERFVRLQARAFGLGGRGEIPFTLEAGAPTLAPDAAGSASVRLGASRDRHSSLDAWLTILFGPSR